jgi:hypothetical protein
VSSLNASRLAPLFWVTDGQFSDLYALQDHLNDLFTSLNLTVRPFFRGFGNFNILYLDDLHDLIIF